MTSSIKLADTQYPIHELLRNRWSARSFSDQSISSYDMNRLLEAASWSFSANNMQPWRYVYAHRHSPCFDDAWENRNDRQNQGFGGDQSKGQAERKQAAKTQKEGKSIAFDGSNDLGKKHL